MKRLSSKDWLETDIIWFLEMEYDGTTFRFSSITMNLNDNDGKHYLYIGGLEDLSIAQRMGTVGEISIQEDTIAIALTFPNRNISKDLYNGKVLSGNRASLGFVLSQKGEVLQNFEERQILHRGCFNHPKY